MPTLSPKRQITLPKALCDRLQVSPGDVLEILEHPKNIDVNNELAWIAYNTKDMAKAKEYLKAAQSTGSKNPELLKRATAINNSKS